MPTDDARSVHEPDELYQRVCAAQEHSTEMARTLGATAGRIAETMDEVAHVQEVIGESRSGTDAALAREHAHHVRVFAEQERREEQRLPANSDQRPVSGDCVRRRTDG